MSPRRHGDDDTVVPRLHSQRMESALKAAGKDVRYVKLKGEDHWLSGSETRLQTLRELDRFVKETIGGKLTLPPPLKQAPPANGGYGLNLPVLKRDASGLESLPVC
ncbi:MAG: prolyl oligopeptidase family serine peptidase [Parvularculaceae bacterium]